MMNIEGINNTDLVLWIGKKQEYGDGDRRTIKVGKELKDNHVQPVPSCPQCHISIFLEHIQGL